MKGCFLQSGTEGLTLRRNLNSSSWALYILQARSSGIVFELKVLVVANSLCQFILVFPWVYVLGDCLLGRLPQVLSFVIKLNLYKISCRS